MSTPTIHLTKPASPQSSPSLFGKLWNFLTAPNAAIQEPDKKRQARFVSTLAIVSALVTTIAVVRIFLVPISTMSSAGLADIFVLMAALYLVYFTSRTKYTNTSIVLLIAVSTIFLYILHFLNPSTSTSLYFLTVGLLFASSLLSLRITAVICILIVLGLLLLSVFSPVADTSPITFIIIVSLLTLVLTYFRNNVETVRKTQITEALQNVEALNRTLFQTNQELVKANALAKEATRIKSEFMATMSHELRTPLNAMLGFSGILIEGMGGEIDADARHMIERLEANAKRLLHLINDILDISRIEAGRLEIVSVPVSPRKLVEDMRKQMSVLAEQKGLTFRGEVDPELPEQLYGDPERLAQIAVNLLSNAFKFTDKGDVKLTLKRTGETWQIVVSDTGVGIPPHALNYIFEEFRQLDGSSKRAYGGTGLGLAITRNLSRMMDGNIRVDSTLNVGSTFTVTLPLRIVPELQSA